MDKYIERAMVRLIGDRGCVMPMELTRGTRLQKVIRVALFGQQNYSASSMEYVQGEALWTPELIYLSVVISHEGGSHARTLLIGLRDAIVREVVGDILACLCAPRHRHHQTQLPIDLIRLLKAFMV